MARYTGPKARISRRLGINIWGTKGETHRPRQAALPARRARSHPAPRQRVRVPAPAAGEAEGPVHLRPVRAAVPQPLRGGQPQGRRHRRDHAALARAAPRQRRLPRRLGGHPPAGPPVRRPRPRARQRQAGRHPELPRPQGRRGHAARRSPARSSCVQWNHRHARSHPATLARGGRRRVRRSPSASCRCASRSTCPCASSSSSSSTPSNPGARRARPVTAHPPAHPVRPTESLDSRGRSTCWSFSARRSRHSATSTAIGSSSPSARSSPASATRSATRCAARCCRRSPERRSRRCASTTRSTSSTPSRASPRTSPTSS